jgi:hypothetical protein
MSYGLKKYCVCVCVCVTLGHKFAKQMIQNLWADYWQKQLVYNCTCA